MVILISWFFQKNRHFSETLWKFFKYRPLPIYLLDKFTNIYSKHVVWTVCPTIMQWTSHKQSSKVVAEDSHQFVLSLNEQQELEALGFVTATLCATNHSFNFNASRSVWVFQSIRVGFAKKVMTLFAYLICQHILK